MTLRVQLPLSYANERHYVLSVVLREHLGLDFVTESRECPSVVISSSAVGRLVLDDTFFSTPVDRWLTAQSLPRQPLDTLDLSALPIKPDIVQPEIPVIYGTRLENNAYVEFRESLVRLGVDVFGSAFFVLSRYEEFVSLERDEHLRFPAMASLHTQEGFLERPIIDEYVQVLWCCLKKLWPRLVAKARSFQTFLTHDVDMPFCAAGQPVLQVAKATVGDVVKRRRPDLAVSRFRAFTMGLLGNVESDPCNTFDWLMDVSEEMNIRSIFYFIARNSGGDVKRYHLDHPRIRKLLRRIHERGHEIGLHPSYNSFRNRMQIKHEFHNLLRVCAEEGISQANWGGRQHYLQWECPTTWRHYEEAGLTYDSTLGYADRIGFRCGTCTEYPTYDLQTRHQLRLRERPLTVMEASLLSDKYMGLEVAAAMARNDQIKLACRTVNGNYVLLWHNSELITKQLRDAFIRSVTD